MSIDILLPAQAPTEQPLEPSPWPTPEQLSSAAKLALEDTYKDFQLSIKIVDATEMQQLNLRYRNKDQPTNVLSFAYHLDLAEDTIADATASYLGDIAMCYSVINQQAVDLQLDRQAHWIHLVVHAVLHLQGYTHELPQDAAAMEQREVSILQALGYSSPY